MHRLDSTVTSSYVCLNRKNGYPAITDANLVLGRILPEFFPSIFGEDEKQPLDAEGAKQALQKIAEQVNAQAKSSGQPEKSVEEVWGATSAGHFDVASATDVTFVCHVTSVDE